MTSCTILLLQEICTDALKVMQFRPSFYATMTENVISPQIGTITAVKRLLYVLRQCEKIMSPISFNMMKKALFSSFYALLLKNQEWSTIKVNEFSEAGLYALVLDLRFIQEFAPSSVREACDRVITKGKELTEGVEIPNEKWILKNMSEGLKQCRN